MKDEDPQTKGFSIRNVLRADDITIELMMGVTVTAPPPYISKDPLPPFDALAAMSESIYPSEDHFTPELPSSLTPSAAKWAPEVLADTNGHPEAPWTAVRDAWGHPVDAADGYDLATAVVAWAKALTWLAVPAGKPPIQLLVDIEKYYLSAPFVGQVA